ncbi:MAG: imidazolonepropionase [Deltaproteobacteria bacterium]|nr:imidazolonepropionase [Deltaproteobacteria bacterium]
MISPGGRIKKIEKISASQLRFYSKKIKREKTIIPGLIDAHTHLVFAGNRADEWTQRLRGVSYQEIAKKGGGILKTLKATRAASLSDLDKSAKKRLRECLSWGVTTVEIKSGYGLNLESELKVLEVIQTLKKQNLSRIVSTFMGAHAVPKEFSTESLYVDYLIQKVLPKVKGLADFQDVFCEKGYFSEKESIRLLVAGKKMGLWPKVHAHEFARSGGVRVAAVTKAASADHLMEVNDADIRQLKSAKVIPVVLPGTSFFLGAKKFAPLRKFWDAGLKPAIASDFNPGTNPTLNLPLCGTFAAIHQGMQPDEILTAQTLNAALALRCFDRGSLEVGKQADFIGLNSESFEEIYYSYGMSQVVSAYIGGKKVL